jgi:hypothetical protein
MPQLDFLIFFNEMFYTLVGFITFYIILYRTVIVKLAHNLKFRYKFSNKMKQAQIKISPNTFSVTRDSFMKLEGINKYIKFIEYRDANLINKVLIEVKDYFMTEKKNTKNK